MTFLIPFLTLGHDSQPDSADIDFHHRHILGRISATKKPGIAGFSSLQRTNSDYPATMAGSGRRAREVIPEAIRAALAACGCKLIVITANRLMGGPFSASALSARQ